MIYTTGTIAGNGSTITGTGTNFTAAGSLIRVGCTLIAFTNPVQVLQLTAVTSAAALSVTPAISPAIAAGTKYAILISDSLSVDGLAQDIAETFGMYQKYMSGFADVMNGTSDVTITINGVSVTVPGQKSLAKKGANSDITSLNGLTTPLSTSQGGTGANTPAGGRKILNAVADGNQIPIPGAGSLNTLFNVLKAQGSMITRNNGVAIIGSLGVRYGSGIYCNISDTHTLILPQPDTGVLAVTCTTDALLAAGTAPAQNVLYGTANTTRAADGTLKAASPVVKLFADGTAETNHESEGATVERVAVGKYLITGVLGLNSDAAWGGTDGGFDIPTDRNKQPLIWLDYEINADGSILVNTYHRTYPDAPEFARNLIGIKNDDGSYTETVKSGEPADIPAGTFVSVRVEMPEESVWNRKIAASEQATQKAIEESERLAAENVADETKQ